MVKVPPALHSQHLPHAGRSGTAYRPNLHRDRFRQATHEAASLQWRSVADRTKPMVPKLAVSLDDATLRLVGAMLLEQNDE